MTRRLGKRIGNRMQREMPLSESASKKHAEIITRGLVIDKPWVDLIVDGKKTWEMRTDLNTDIEVSACMSPYTALLLHAAAIGGGACGVQDASQCIFVVPRRQSSRPRPIECIHWSRE
jgi:hypothetical protein